MRILIIEDEIEIADYIRDYLEGEAHAVDVAHDGPGGEAFAFSEPYDLIILDIMLPGKSGVDLLNTLRENGVDTPVLLLTALGSVKDRVTGLDAGADDYLTKPFAVAELGARIRALLRRNAPHASPLIRAGDLSLNPATREVRKGDAPIDLTNREYAVLEYLLRNKGRIVSKGMIAEHVWDHGFSSDYNLIEVYIRRLRNKIENKGSVGLIRTVRNSGYKIHEPE